MSEFVLITLLVALGTYLIRLLPTLLMRGTGDASAPISRFLAATGPAAIAALYVGAVIGQLAPDWAVIAPLVAGSGAVVMIFLWRRDVTVATLGGAIVYGLVFAVM